MHYTHEKTSNIIEDKNTIKSRTYFHNTLISHYVQYELIHCVLLLFLSEEADDEDDPEYNFLEDLREPDQEDYRTDRAVRITSTLQ